MEEYTVTIPLDEYRNLIQTQREMDNMIDYIFGVANYDFEADNIDFDDQSMYLILIYFKNIFSYAYQQKLDLFKQNYIKRESEYDKVGGLNENK